MISDKIKEIIERNSTLPAITSLLLSEAEKIESVENRNFIKEKLKDIPYSGDCLVLRWDKQNGEYNISPVSTFNGDINSIPEWIEYGETTMSPKTVCSILGIPVVGDTPEAILWKKGGRSMVGVKALIDEAIKKANIKK